MEVAFLRPDNFIFVHVLIKTFNFPQDNLFPPLKTMTKTNNVCQHLFKLMVSLLLLYLGGLEKPFHPFPQWSGWPARSGNVSVSAAAVVVMCSCLEGHLESFPYPPSQSPGWLRERGQEQAAGQLHVASSFPPVWHCLAPDLSAVTRCNSDEARKFYSTSKHTMIVKFHHFAFG